MSISTSDFKNGLTIELNDGIWEILEFQHVKPGKGPAFVRTKLKNLRSGSIQDKTFRTSEKFEKARIETRKMQYLFAAGDEHTFMDQETYDQLMLTADQLKYELNFILENMTVDIVTYEGETLGVKLPLSVELEVKETDPGIKGNTASGGSKPAVMETGMTVNVPFFVNAGDRLVIDTRKGEYISRV